jgi:uncharacterized membrane protein
MTEHAKGATMTGHAPDKTPTPARGGTGKTRRSTAALMREPAALTYAAAVVTAGLIAGLFFFNATTVMPALADLDDRTFIEVLNQINDAVYNPAFFAVLFGAPVLIAVAAVQLQRGENPDAARWAWAALALYGAGLIVTMAVNVPLTDELVAAGEPETITDPAAVREDFENPFNAGDIVRTILHTAAVACLAVMPARS